MKKFILSLILPLLLVFLVACETIVLTQDPKNPNVKSGSNENSIIIDKNPIETSDNTFDTSSDLEIPEANTNQNGFETLPDDGQAAIPPSLEDELILVECSMSTNGNEQQEKIINLDEINSPEIYQAKKKEILELVNSCYNIKILEEYEVLPGETAFAEGVFYNKILESDSIFKVIPFYEVADVYDYEGFIGTQSVTYITNSQPSDIFNFYQGIQPTGYKYTDFIQDQKLVFTNETEKKTIIIDILPHGFNTLIKYDLIQQFDAE